jgi:hypothetical protein
MPSYLPSSRTMPLPLWPRAVQNGQSVRRMGWVLLGLMATIQPAHAEIAFARMDRLVPPPVSQSPGETFTADQLPQAQAPSQGTTYSSNGTMASKAAAAAAAVTAAINGPRLVVPQGDTADDADPLDVRPGDLPGSLPTEEGVAETATESAPECRDTASGARFCAVAMDRLEGRAAGWLRVAPRAPDYAVGQAFPIYDHNMLIDPTRYGLPPVTGPWRYYKTETATYRVSASDGTVLEVMPR